MDGRISKQKEERLQVKMEKKKKRKKKWDVY